MDENWEIEKGTKCKDIKQNELPLPEFLNKSASSFNDATADYDSEGKPVSEFTQNTSPVQLKKNTSTLQSTQYRGEGGRTYDMAVSFINGYIGGGRLGRRCDRNRGRAGGQGGDTCFNPQCIEEGHVSPNCPKGKTNHGRDMAGGGRRRGGSLRTHEEESERPAPLFYPKELDESELFDLGVKKGVNFEAYNKIPMKVTGEGPIPEAVPAFKDMSLQKVLLDNLTKAEFLRPTPIQKYAIPIFMNRRDLMACAQTGSGKTAAFLLPMLHYILENGVDSHCNDEVAWPVGLVLSPTRELAVQIFQEARKFSLHTVVKNVCIYGGVATSFQLKCMKYGCHIMIATPGKLLFLLEMGKISLKSLKFLVFDEADLMLDMGFIQDMEKLMAHPDMPPKGERQTMMFSATFPEEVQQCALCYLDNYLFLVLGQVGAANKDVCQTIVKVAKFDKRDKLVDYLRSLEDSKEKVLVFVRMKRQADFIGAYISSNGFRSITLHGARYQKQREEALHAFRCNQFKVMVATSLAARGLDIRGVGYVINYDLPKTGDEYVHRIGRTGRVGNRGHSVSFYDPEHDHSIAKDLLRILKDAEQEVPSWLSTAAQGTGATHYSSGRFASRDIRDQDDEPKAASGPTHLRNPVTQVDEIWDV